MNIINDYRHKLGQCESELCECGQIETVQHYLLQCQLYEEERNILYNRLREQLGIHTPKVYTLLGYEGHREISTCREQIMQEVGQYIERTESFRTLHPNRYCNVLVNYYQKHTRENN